MISSPRFMKTIWCALMQIDSVTDKPSDFTTHKYASNMHINSIKFSYLRHQRNFKTLSEIEKCNRLDATGMCIDSLLKPCMLTVGPCRVPASHQYGAFNEDGACLRHSILLQRTCPTSVHFCLDLKKNSSHLKPKNVSKHAESTQLRMHENATMLQCHNQILDRRQDADN